MDDGHAYATLARGASHRGDGSAVPRTFQVLSGPRGRSSLDGAALCGAQCSARILSSVPRTGDGPAFGAVSAATRQSSTRDRCPCQQTGGSMSSPWRPRPSWRRCGVRWCAEYRLAGRHGKSARRSVWAWSRRYVRVVDREDLPHPKSLFKTPDPFSSPLSFRKVVTMCWIECVGNRKPIETLYSKPPSLNGVRVLEVTLHQDGPRVSLRVDLNEFPDRPPRKWTAGGFNRVQLILVLIEVRSLSIQGWSLNNVVDAILERTSDGVVLRLHGRGTAIEGVFSLSKLKRSRAIVMNSGRNVKGTSLN